MPSHIPSFLPSIIPSYSPSSYPTSDPSSTPSASISISPSFIPTTTVYRKCGMNEDDRIVEMRNILNTVSDPDMLLDTGTPQNRAFEWITQIDPYTSCPQDANLIQRYIMAVFYFSTGGGYWRECNAPTNPNDVVEVNEKNKQCGIRATDNSYSDAWLTPSNE
eukprot:788109-Ditylum_brightwellii.AAC.1